tara:strand:- start:691 stop:912 length:222 start_codon:yes stop_codon:yes gene_type:complete
MSWGKIMSGEQLTPSDLNNPTSEIKLERRKRRVNINDLLDKVREQKNKERKENYIFLMLILGVLAVTGIIASL